MLLERMVGLEVVLGGGAATAANIIPAVPVFSFLPITWQTVAALVAAGALAYAILSPIRKQRKQQREDATILRRNIRLYLDVLNDKIEWIRGTIGSVVPGRYEQLTVQNHDALEQFSIHSGPLSLKERNSLLEFVRYFKATPTMTEADFPVYYKKLREMLDLFPKQ